MTVEARLAYGRLVLVALKIVGRSEMLKKGSCNMVQVVHSTFEGTHRLFSLTRKELLKHVEASGERPLGVAKPVPKDTGLK